jgi:hypothetical protein
MFSILITIILKKKGQTFVRELRILQAQPKILKKNYPNIKSTNQNQHFSKKKVCLVPQKWKTAKHSYNGYPTLFAHAAFKSIGLKIERTKCYADYKIF